MYLHTLFSSIICLLWFKLCWEHQQSMLLYYWPLDLPHRFTYFLEKQKTICCLLLFCWSRLQQKLFGFNVTYKNGASCILTTPLCCDNQSAIHIASWMNQAHWVEIDCHFICQHLLQGNVLLRSIFSIAQLADSFTNPIKCLISITHAILWCPYMWAWGWL